ncbi:hypothetical protein KSP40_PGU022098 [Platanthera guangdongensis]|uniref:Uncharacterized protein n=1 Tax=Platanthera guangdongensis TaxID=2320717 RepID=A0ABR2MDL0_9ASPA
MMIEEDLTAREKRLLEMRRNAQADRAAKSLATITVSIDGPVSNVGIITTIKPLLPPISQVSEMEAVVSRGESVVEEEAECID